MASSLPYNDGRSWQNVGGQADPIGPRTIFRIAFDQYGDAYAATNNGLFRWDAVPAPVVGGPRPGRPDRLPAL